VKPLLIMENVRAYYRQLLVNREVYSKAVDGVSLEVKKNEILGLVGESGCGKSTLSRIMMMDVAPPLEFISGDVKLYTRDGEELALSKMNRAILRRKVWGKHISIVPQYVMDALMPTLRIDKIAYDVLRSHMPEISIGDTRKLLKERLREVGLPDRVSGMYPFELSGGMRQRAVIAIATLLKPELLIVDEPVSALDVVSQKMVLKTLKDLVRSGIVESIIFITHDISTVRQIADRIAVMYAGKIVEVAGVEDIISNPLHPYTSGLISSVMSIERKVRERGISYIPGQPPDLFNPPAGCRFHDRCPHVMDICIREEPPLIDYEGGRKVACWLRYKR